MANNTTKITTNQEVSRKISRVVNVDDCEITISETKLENILMKHIGSVTSGNDWKTPLGLIVTVSLVFLTSEFNKDFLGASKYTWCAIFVIILIGSVVWLTFSIIKRIKNRKMTLNKLISTIKNQTE